MPFDIRSLLDTSFPSALCPRCGAIFSKIWSAYRERDRQQCPVCKVVLRTDPDNWHDFFGRFDCLLSAKEPMEHAQRLASLACTNESTFSPMQKLFFLMSASNSFVHVITWSASNDMIGALAMLATRVSVRGVIGGVTGQQVDLLTSLQEEIRGMEIKVFGDRSDWDAPHQKLIIVDGLIAIEGSANLTFNAWRKAADDKERIRMVTEIDEVRELNNRYFSKLFRSRQFEGHTEITGADFPVGTLT